MLSQNQIKYLSSLKQKKYRIREKKFLIEGFHLIEECLNSNYNLETVIIRDNLKINKKLISELNRKNVKLESVNEKQFRKLAEAKNSQGIIGIVSLLRLNSLNLLHSPVLALDRINDPGNLGTILRTAYWFGVKNVLIGTGSVDVLNPKVLRSSQGALFHINILNNLNLAKELLRLDSAGFNVLLFEPDADNSLPDIDKRGKYVLVFGNEAGGISNLLLDMKYKRIKIDSFSKCESLNVAVACGIALYHLRQ